MLHDFKSTYSKELRTTRVFKLGNLTKYNRQRKSVGFAGFDSSVKNPNALSYNQSLYFLNGKKNSSLYSFQKNKEKPLPNKFLDN
jgi:hypothetical protein